MKKFAALLLCVMLACTAVAAGAEEGVYRALYSSEVTSLNYLTVGNQWSQTVGANVIDTLVEYNSVGEIIPGLAETWTESEDGLTWTFNLRKGQKWYDTNGAEVAEVTAQDFVDALKYVLTPENESDVESAVETARILNASAYYNKEVTDFAQVGVKAVDTYTVQYTLESPTPYFLSCLTYGCFMPAYGSALEEYGTEFGTSADKMLYCGAYILTRYEPQVGHTYEKNVNNWDADNVHIEKIERIYNSEASTLSPIMAIRGEVDGATLDMNVLDEYKSSYGEIVTRGRTSPSYSYFYCFNFDPKFDASYEPDNWRIAVNNSNFRHSIMSGLDRLYVMRATEPDEPEKILQNTVTPATFISLDGKDFSALEQFDGIEGNYFDPDKALEYKEKAIEELTAAGCTFPVKIVVGYKSGDTDWENECILLKQQLEGLLGTDYITCELFAGPSENFLGTTRRGGLYGLMKCNWGADYADPETWTDPFAEKIDAETGLHAGNGYNKMDKMLDTDGETKDILVPYYAKVNEAKAITTDMPARFAAFAEAEAMLIDNAMVIPYRMSQAEYQLTKLNAFEGEYAPFGVSVLRFKYQTLHDEFITADEYNAEFDKWLAAMGK